MKIKYIKLGLISSITTIVILVFMVKPHKNEVPLYSNGETSSFLYENQQVKNSFKQNINGFSFIVNKVEQFKYKIVLKNISRSEIEIYDWTKNNMKDKYNIILIEEENSVDSIMKMSNRIGAPAKVNIATSILKPNEAITYEIDINNKINNYPKEERNIFEKLFSKNKIAISITSYLPIYGKGNENDLLDFQIKDNIDM